MIYLPKQVYELVKEALILPSDFTRFMAILDEKKTMTFANWIKEQKHAVDLVDIFYRKQEIAPIPDTISYETAVKDLMDGKIIKVIGPVSYEEKFRTCYYKKKFYTYDIVQDVWKISRRFFEWTDFAYVDSGETVDLNKMQIAGVNWK